VVTRDQEAKEEIEMLKKELEKANLERDAFRKETLSSQNRERELNQLNEVLKEERAKNDLLVVRNASLEKEMSQLRIEHNRDNLEKEALVGIEVVKYNSILATLKLREDEITNLKHQISEFQNKQVELPQTTSDVAKLALLLQDKDSTIRTLTEEKQKIEKQTTTIAQQLMQMCDKLETMRDVEKENNALREDVRLLKGDILAHETEMDTILIENEALIQKLESKGVIVLFTGTDIEFKESTAPQHESGKELRQSSSIRDLRMSSPLRNLSLSRISTSPRSSTPQTLSTSSNQSLPHLPRSSPSRENIAKLMQTMSIDDLLG